MLTRGKLNQISEDLLNKLLVSLHPKQLGPASTTYDIGYQRAQQDFRAILENRLNTGPLPDMAELPTEALPKRRWLW